MHMCAPRQASALLSRQKLIAAVYMRWDSVHCADPVCSGQVLRISSMLTAASLMRKFNKQHVVIN